MKKTIFAIILGCLTLNCYALPAWYANSPGCYPAYPGDDLTGCFLNKTGGNLDDFSFMVTGYYKDGSTERAIANLGGTQPNFYTGASTLKAQLEVHKIEKFEFSIITGDAQSPHVLRGCNMEITVNSSPKQEMTLIKDGDEIHC